MNGPRITIRQADGKDVDRLVALLQILFDREEDFIFDPARQRRGLELMLTNDRGRLLVAEAEGQVIGMCSGQLTVSTAEGGPALLVEDVVVCEDMRGKGIGRALMDAIATWAEERGVSRLQLLADRNNDEGLAFYAKLGWQTTQLICLRRKTG